MKQIIDYADRSNAVLLWNSNPQDLQGQGLKYAFNLLKSGLGPALHVRPLDSRDYPYQDLIKLLVGMDYVSSVCLEASGAPPDPIRAERFGQAGPPASPQTLVTGNLENASGLFFHAME